MSIKLRRSSKEVQYIVSLGTIGEVEDETMSFMLQKWVELTYLHSDWPHEDWWMETLREIHPLDAKQYRLLEWNVRTALLGSDMCRILWESPYVLLGVRCDVKHALAMITINWR